MGSFLRRACYSAAAIRRGSANTGQWPAADVFRYNNRHNNDYTRFCAAGDPPPEGFEKDIALMRPLRFATFLAPSLFPVYQAIAEYAGRQLGVPTTLTVGESFDAFARGEADVGFICGLPYVMLTRRQPAPVELLAAPVLAGARYGGQPIYYSDVIVRRDSPFQAFADLRGRRWSYNDLDSHSGYNITRYQLVQMGETRGFFGAVIEAGWHQRSIELVRSGAVDASAIDSQVLAVALRDDP